MQSHFYELADFLTSNLEGEEVFTASFSGEDSDFVRLNQSKVRQPGHVAQRTMSVDLIEGGRHASGSTTLSGDREEDRERLLTVVRDLREKRSFLPEDPHLLIATEVRSTEQIGENAVPDAGDTLFKILAAGEGKDLVGIYSSGGIYAGFANSYGQRNWFASHSFNLDWSFYLRGDKAVKASYAGFTWEDEAFDRKVRAAADQLDILGRDSKTIEPGRYRVYLAPAAFADFAGMIAWGGFGQKAHRTKQTVLLKMAEDGIRLDPSITISENTVDGVAPNFQGDGFLKPDRVSLIAEGGLADCLTSPRSAKEYGVESNGANAWEVPESPDIAGGDLDEADVLRKLDTGLYVNNVHYLNFSDRTGARVTGLTRFATFWVENGEIVAPLEVMRFDETIYRAMGENLLGLTKEREMILEPGTYGGRQTGSSRVPGALIDDFSFNL